MRNSVVKKDTYQLITDTIIEAMQSRQIIPWRKTWTHGLLSPMNYYSKHQYRGINALLCALSPYATPYFLTLKQVNKLGGKVRKGYPSHEPRT
jgi:antirestriction protein ArdC